MPAALPPCRLLDHAVKLRYSSPGVGLSRNIGGGNEPITRARASASPRGDEICSVSGSILACERSISFSALRDALITVPQIAKIRYVAEKRYSILRGCGARHPAQRLRA